MVINVGRLKAGDDDYVLKDILAVTEACRDGGAVSKVIIETALLTDEEKRRACELSRKRARALRQDLDRVRLGRGHGRGRGADGAESCAARAWRSRRSGGIRTFDDAAQDDRGGRDPPRRQRQHRHRAGSPEDRAAKAVRQCKRNGTAKAIRSTCEPTACSTACSRSSPRSRRRWRRASCPRRARPACSSRSRRASRSTASPTSR